MKCPSRQHCEREELQQRIEALRTQALGFVQSLCSQSEDIGRLKQRIEALEAVLKEIANGGCGLGEYIPSDFDNPPRFKSCVEMTDDKSDWCWGCIARQALLPGRGDDEL